jgi:hypothetical protein
MGETLIPERGWNDANRGEGILDQARLAMALRKPAPTRARALSAARKAMRAALPADAELYVGRRGRSHVFLTRICGGGALAAMLPVVAAEERARAAADEAGGANLVFEVCDVDSRDCSAEGMRRVPPTSRPR